MSVSASQWVVGLTAGAVSLDTAGLRAKPGWARAVVCRLGRGDPSVDPSGHSR